VTAKDKGTRPPNTLQRKLPKDKTTSRDIADLVTESVAGNVIIARTWSGPVYGVEIDATDLYTAIDAAGEAVNRGDLQQLERMLAAQAVSLNSMFVRLAQLAHDNTGFEQYHTNMRLAFKAQSQCRNTIETLALMKNPPVFAKQANIASGSQQVNNVGQLNQGIARAGLPAGTPSKLLEGAINGERLDAGASSETIQGHPAVEAMGAVNGAAHGGRQGARVQKRLQGRAEAERARPRPRAQPVTQ
jgi:hypothetical protein